MQRQAVAAGGVRGGSTAGRALAARRANAVQRHRLCCRSTAPADVSTAKAATALHAPGWPRGVHVVPMEVRDTELDQFGVVNNNRYGEYMQHGRHCALKSMGAGVADYQNRGTLMALSELNIKFKAPLRSGDAFRVETAVEQVTAARLVMRQAVVREAAPGQGQGQGQGESLCAEGLATVVFIDAGYKPMRLPAEDRAVFEALRAAAAGEARDGGLNGNGK